ncbi:MAG: SIS domain-containing protein [Anaerolineae bacterium]|jgi:glucosamine--fructose-6-phosphate aminotransferase (isomerizing)|nr:SIS domain-containing protein [Anaerolineae bacterium]
MPSRIAQAIALQPDIIAQLIETQQTAIQQIAHVIRDFDPRMVMIASYGHAANYAQYLFGTYAGLPVLSIAPTLYTLYQAPPLTQRTLLIAIAPTGDCRDLHEIIVQCQRQETITLSLTHNPDSPLAQAADYHIRLGEYTPEALTGSYPAQLTALAMLVAAITETAELQDTLAHLVHLMHATLHMTAEISRWIEQYRHLNRILIAGRGYNETTASEITRVINHVCTTRAELFGEIDWLYRTPIPADTPVLVIAPWGKTLRPMIELLNDLAQRQIDRLVICNDHTLSPFANHVLPLPIGLPEWLSPICAVLPGQVFAERLARLQLT